MSDPKMRPVFLIGAGILLVCLVVSMFGLTSLNLPFISPTDSQQTILLFVLSTIIFLSLVIFGFILFRSLLKLFIERRANQLGAKFKTKLVCGALGLSLLPVCFLFLFSYSLINRTLDKWFSRPFERMSADTRSVMDVMGGYARNKAVTDARELQRELESGAAGGSDASDMVRSELGAVVPRDGVDYAALVNVAGEIVAERRFQADFPERQAFPPQSDVASPSQVFEISGHTYVLGRAPLRIGNETWTVLVGGRLPAQVSESVARLNQESIVYENLIKERKFLRKIYLSILLLLTVLILFIATWFALFLSRQITVPIQALAEATHEVSRGNLHFRVRTRATDELGILVRSFNEMTEQLAAGRAELEKSRNHLERMNTQLDQRHRFTEAILESIPTGVISVSGKGIVLGANTAAHRLFGRNLAGVQDLSELFSPEDLQELDYLLKRAARTGQATRQADMRLDGHVSNLAITVSALAGEPPGASTGDAKPGDSKSGWFVVVLEDMSDLMRAQRAAAWGEVAQRIAHEIKNPLTPITLSTDRIHLWLERQKRASNGSADLNRVISDSCVLIRQEVENLKRLVDEFSQFSRFPKAVPQPANINQILEGALAVFDGRLEGISIRKHLDSNVPLVQADSGQFRRAFVNLIDNAAEAMENSVIRELTVSTALDEQRDVVTVTIADTGHGITVEDKEKLFLPYFSTKERGTGLGLAIVSRIIADHEAVIRVEDNRPVGSRFIIEMPVVGSPVAT